MVKPWGGSPVLNASASISGTGPASIGRTGLHLSGPICTEWRATLSSLRFLPAPVLPSAVRAGFREKRHQGIDQPSGLGVEACRRLCEWSGAPWMLENPLARLRAIGARRILYFIRTNSGAGLAERMTITASAPASWTGGEFPAAAKAASSRRISSALHPQHATVRRPWRPSQRHSSRLRPRRFRGELRSWIAASCVMPWSRSEGMFTVPFDMLA